MGIAGGSKVADFMGESKVTGLAGGSEALGLAVGHDPRKPSRSSGSSLMLAGDCEAVGGRVVHEFVIFFFLSLLFPFLSFPFP